MVLDTSSWFVDDVTFVSLSWVASLRIRIDIYNRPNLPLSAESILLFLLDGRCFGLIPCLFKSFTKSSVSNSRSNDIDTAAPFIVIQCVPRSLEASSISLVETKTALKNREAKYLIWDIGHFINSTTYIKTDYQFLVEGSKWPTQGFLGRLSGLQVIQQLENSCTTAWRACS